MTKNYLVTLLTKYLPLLVALAVLAPLLARNPFSDRTLIPNFEPFPDALYYVQPPHCLLKGFGWELCRSWETNVGTITPPGYSLALLPFFVIHNDTRMFYVANIVLAVISVCLLYALVRKITPSFLVQVLVLLLFVTNFYTYWVPTLAMAENLAVPLFLLGLFIVSDTPTLVRATMLVVTAFALYQTKHALLPLTATFMLASGLQYWSVLQKSSTFKKQLRQWRFGVGALLLVSLLLGVYFNVHTISWVFSSSFFKTTLDSTEGVWFSVAFFPNHFPAYLSTLLGSSQRFLWNLTPLMPTVVGAGGVLGSCIAFWKLKRQRLLFGTMLLSTAVHIAFMSTFYTLDVRYIYHVFPAMLVGTVALLELVRTNAAKYLPRMSFTTGMVLLLIVLCGTSAVRLKRQVGLNLRHSESPWWYHAVSRTSHYFSDKQFDQQPVVITAIPPFLVDYYGQNRFMVLPLSTQQDFHQYMPAIWGPGEYADLIELYKTYLRNGRELYVTNYGTAGAGYIQDSFTQVSNSFTLTQVQEGCYELCNLYRVDELVQ